MPNSSTKKKQNIWNIVILVTPFFLIQYIGRTLVDSSDNSIVYSGIFGGIGALIGFLLLKLVSNKTQTFKITTLALATILGFGILFFLQPKEQSDETLLELEWKTQQIGKIEFDTPHTLTPISDPILEEAKSLHNKLNIYTDGKGNGRVTIFMEAELKKDTLDIYNLYTNTLSGYLSKLSVNPDDVEFEVYTSDSIEVSAMFSFRLEEELIHGYGLMYKEAHLLESIWLMPISRGYSKEYIEEFDFGVIADYESN